MFLPYKREFFLPAVAKPLSQSDCFDFLCIIAEIKHLEANVVVFWQYINSFEENSYDKINLTALQNIELGTKTALGSTQT